MRFTEGPGHREVVLSEGNAHIFTLDVQARGPVAADRVPITSYSVHRGELIEIIDRFEGHRQTGLGTGSGMLVLGDHPVADRLRGLDMAEEPMIVGIYPDARIILLATGTPVGAAREYVGHIGANREQGRLGLSYPGPGAIDLYAVPDVPGQPMRSSHIDAERTAHS